MTQEHSPAHPIEGDRTLLVQSCQFAQFTYLAALVKERFPETTLEALVFPRNSIDLDRPEMRAFERILTPASPGWQGREYSRVIVPTTNRGHIAAKWFGSRASGNKFEIDYEGNLTPLRTSRLFCSLLVPLSAPNDDFRNYQSLRPIQLGKKVLVSESCDPALVRLTEPRWEASLPGAYEITRARREASLRALAGYFRRDFDSALVFFSGEKGYLRLKLLPFLLGIPRIVAVTESGALIDCKGMSLIRHLFQRIRFGVASPRRIPKILFVQTEGDRICSRAIAHLKSPGLYPDSQILVLCRAEDAALYRGLDEVDEVFAVSKRHWVGNMMIIRQLRNENPDIAVAVLSGRPVFHRFKLLYWLFGDRKQIVFNSGLDCFQVTPRTLPFLVARGEMRLPEDLEAQDEKTTILMVQTEHRDMVKESIRRMGEAQLYPRGAIHLVCRREDLEAFSKGPAVDRLSTYPESLREWWQFARSLRADKPDMLSLVLSGRPVFLSHKVLFLLLFPLRRKLVFNANLDAYWLTLRNVPRIFSREPLLVPDTSSPAATARIVVFQTENVPMLQDVVRRLRSDRLYPGCSITLVGRRNDRSEFAGLPGLDRYVAYPSGWREWSRLTLQLRRERPALVASVFSGRPVFRPHKWLQFFVFPFHPKLVFNAQLDAYWVSLRTLGRLTRREPLLFAEPHSTDSFREHAPRVLLVQTESVVMTRKVLIRLLGGEAVGSARVELLCREGDRNEFAEHLEETEIRTFPSGLSLKNLRLGLHHFATDRDVTVAILSGRPIFRSFKLLFFLLPSRERLVFNANLDCFFLKRCRLARAFRLPSLYASHRGPGKTLRHALLQCAKVCLFLPRFVYLMGWTTVQKLLRARRLGEDGSFRINRW